MDGWMSFFLFIRNSSGPPGFHLPSSSPLKTCHCRSPPSSFPLSILGFSMCFPSPHVPSTFITISSEHFHPPQPVTLPSWRCRSSVILVPYSICRSPPSPRRSSLLHGLLVVMSLLCHPSPLPDPSKPFLPSLVTFPPRPAHGDAAPLPSQPFT